jgi:tetratricopeptide (TPR) repeat protein
LLRTADLSIEEAVRDLNIGDLESVERRLQLVKATSREHRLKAEIVRAMLDRLKGDPTTALARLRAVREKIDPSDTELIELVDTVELSAIKDQEALSACCEHYNFALFQARRGHYEEARAAAGRALGWVPHHAPTHALLGKVHYLLGEHDPATYHLERALAVDPTNRSASRLLGRMRQAGSIQGLRLERIRSLLSDNIVAIFVVLALILLGLAALLAR